MQKTQEQSEGKEGREFSQGLGRPLRRQISCPVARQLIATEASEVSQEHPVTETVPNGQVTSMISSRKTSSLFPIT